MSATMMDNPAQQERHRHRRKIIDSFEINLNRCILCGICVEGCNFDAIEMTHEHELSTYVRNGDRMDLPALLELGKKFQEDTGWIPPTQRGKKDEADEKPDPSTETSAEASTEAKELEQA